MSDFQSETLEAICLIADAALLNKRLPAEVTALIPLLIAEPTARAPETIAEPTERKALPTELQNPILIVLNYY